MLSYQQNGFEIRWTILRNDSEERLHEEINQKDGWNLKFEFSQSFHLAGCSTVAALLGRKGALCLLSAVTNKRDRTNDQQSQREKAILIGEITLPQSQLICNWDTLVSVCRKQLGIPPPTAQGALPFSPPGIPGASSSQLRGRPGIRREGWRCWASGGAASVHHRVSPHPLEWVVDSTRGPKELHHTGTWTNNTGLSERIGNLKGDPALSLTQNKTGKGTLL